MKLAVVTSHCSEEQTVFCLYSRLRGHYAVLDGSEISSIFPSANRLLYRIPVVGCHYTVALPGSLSRP